MPINLSTRERTLRIFTDPKGTTDFGSATSWKTQTETCLSQICRFGSEPVVRQ